MTANFRQKLYWMVLLPLALIVSFVLDWKIAFAVATFALCAFYGAIVFFRLFSVVLGLLRSGEHRVTADELAALSDAELPIYTVLVPMYREPEVAQKIIHAVTHLDYPPQKLDVKLLLEEDDAPTRAKVAEVVDQLPACVEIIVAPAVPPGQPKTKPRACNWGLDRARGDFLVIFDAEDQPEPDQLKKAVIAFRRLDAAHQSAVACLQAKLNYFNARQNWLTRFFTLEYTNWFDLFLPGLHAAGAVIPLGGTSNHFRTGLLREIGGWDPFNVTEDCDLGVRLARHGYRTEVLDSTTWEEANSRLPNWIRQRSRWIKGYLQTHLVHTRNSVLPLLVLGGLFAFLGSHHQALPGDRPLIRQYAAAMPYVCTVLATLTFLCAGYSVWRRFRQWREAGVGQLGVWRSVSFRFTVGGLSLMLLLNLVFWAMTAAYLFREPIAAALPESVAQFKWSGTTNLRQSMREWKLYYTEITDNERYAGTTVWNTAAQLWREGSWPQAREQLAVIDRWSLVSQIFFPVAIMLFFANFVFVLLGLVSCHKRQLWDLLPSGLMMPAYWVLISVAAVKALVQLCSNPWYWEKTVHGLTPPPAAPSPSLSEVTSRTCQP